MLIVSLIACVAIGYFVEIALQRTEHSNPPLRGAQLGVFFGVGLWLTNTLVLHRFDQRPLLFTFAVGFAVIIGLVIAGIIVGLFHRKDRDVPLRPDATDSWPPAFWRRGYNGRRQVGDGTAWGDHRGRSHEGSWR